MIDQRTFDSLNKCDWDLIILDLTRYAKDCLDILSNAKVKVPKDRQPVDFAKEAIKLLYGGERNWDQLKYPDVTKFLKNSVIDSLISNSVGSPEVKNKAKTQIPVNSGESDEALNLSDIVKSKEPTAEMEIIAEEIISKIRYANKDDDDATLVLEELVKYSKPREISADLGISIEEVRKIIKRIRRRAKGSLDA